MVLFDFDGTLADSIALGFEIANAHADKCGYNRVEREQGMEMSALEIMKAAGISFWKLPHLLFLLKKRLEENSDKIKIISGVENLIKKLKNEGFELGIVTSHSANGVSLFLKKYNLDTFFSYIKTDVPLFGKTNALRKAKRQLNSSFVYVGDELRDIEACHKTGIPIVSVPWGFNKAELLEKHNPGFVAKTAEEAYSLICLESDKLKTETESK